MKKFVLISMLLTVIICAGCKHEVEEVIVSPECITMGIGDVYTVTAKVKPASASQKVTWTSTNETVAIVSATGSVTAIGIGECDVEAAAAGYKDVCHVMVVETGGSGDTTGPVSDGVLKFTVNGVKFNMIKIKGGSFIMGANKSDYGGIASPMHDVTLSDYILGETEVTQELWKAVTGENPANFVGENMPVEQVSWNDCQVFISKLNQILVKELRGKTFRLPTEAEWEYAAGKHHNNKYAGGNDMDKVGWYLDNSCNTTHPVAGKQVNELGLYDMSGNVAEWCNDKYGSYSSGHQTNPTGASGGSYNVIRGGNWGYAAETCRVTYREKNLPEYKNYLIGMRLALTCESE